MKRNKFNLSHHHLTTCDMGKLIPIGCVEALPGDTIRHHTNVLVRVSPLAAPVMHPVTARVHHFFVPNRGTWNKKDWFGEADDSNGSWEDFITGGADGLNNSKPPTITTTTTAGDLQDHLGLPRVAGVAINAMPIRAINAAFNEYYRDADLVTKRLADDLTVPNIAWEKDYFTSARPFSQKGSEVTLPVGGQAPIAHGETVNGTPISVLAPAIGSAEYALNSGGGLLGASTTTITGEALYADLSAATGASINDVRRAFAIQRYQEARSRYGSRYTEYLRYLAPGLTPSDARLQRPEFLGGGKVQINFSEILQSSPNTGQLPANDYGVGDMYGHGIAAMRSNAYQRFIEEHGYIVTFLSVRPKTMYQNGIHRSYLRDSKEDWFQRELQYIGQQEIFNAEIWAAADGSEKETFGYNDRYSDYREVPSLVSNEFRDVLNYWHMARDFATAPSLNSDFIECDATKRIHNVQQESALWVMAQHKMVARRIVASNPAPRVM
ncbi:major capsid protein [Microviridae sp.]|nr:major capsid protein [Microviridae sp.]